MSAAKLEPGDVVQLDPYRTTNAGFSGCMLVVTDVYDWGVQGYVQSLGTSRLKAGGQAHYRAENGTFEYVGKSAWGMDG